MDLQDFDAHHRAAARDRSPFRHADDDGLDSAREAAYWALIEQDDAQYRAETARLRQRHLSWD